MATTSTFKMTQADYDEFDRQVLCAPFMQAEMLRRAKLGAAYAQAIAPRETGEYADSIEADVYVRRIPVLDGRIGRAVGRVSAGTDHADVVEFGHVIPGGVQQGHRVLGRSLGVMGGD